MIKIESKNNTFFKLLKKLKDRKYREKEQLFLVEGEKILEYSQDVKFYILREDIIDEYKQFDFFQKESCIVLSQALYKDLSTQENSQGIITICKYKHSKVENFKSDIILLDKIQDPGNLGTIVRIGDAVGIKDFILIKGTVDIYNEKVIRSTMGSIFSINFVYMDELEALKYLKERAYCIISSTLNENSINYTDMIVKEKNVLVFGNEGQGISKIFQENSDQYIKIPIYGNAESLNVAVATGIIVYKYKELKNI